MMAGENEGKAPSIAESLAAAVETVEKGAPQDAPAAPVPEAAPAPTPAAEPAKPPAPDARPRDATGRFARTADTPMHAAPPAPVPQAQQPTAPTDQPTAPTVKQDQAPSSWRDPAKAKWAALDPEVKAEVTRREHDISLGLQRAAEVRKFGDSIMQEIAPYMDDLRAEGASPVDAVRTLFETFYMFRHGSPEHKRALALSLMQQYGITFEQPVDFQRASLEHEIDTRKIGDRRATTVQQSNEQQEVYTAVEAFAAAPGHEHFDSVRQIMAGLLREGQVNTLQEAYDQACWAHPQIRPMLLQQQNLQRVQEATARSRNASASISGGPGAVATSPAVDPKNLRATIEAQFNAGRL